MLRDRGQRAGECVQQAARRSGIVRGMDRAVVRGPHDESSAAVKLRLEELERVRPTVADVDQVSTRGQRLRALQPKPALAIFAASSVSELGVSKIHLTKAYGGKVYGLSLIHISEPTRPY